MNVIPYAAHTLHDFYETDMCNIVYSYAKMGEDVFSLILFEFTFSKRPPANPKGGGNDMRRRDGIFAESNTQLPLLLNSRMHYKFFPFYFR